MSRHGTQLLRKKAAEAQARQDPEPIVELPDWRFCVRCNVLEPGRRAGDACGFCGGALMPTTGPVARRDEER